MRLLLATALVAATVVACSSTTTITKDDPSSSSSGDGGKKTSDDSDAKSIGTSGSRLKTKWIVAEDGARTLKGLYDSERDADCYFAKMSDGNLHCVPWSLGAYPTIFTDAACKKPLAYGTNGCTAKTASLSENYCAGESLTHVYEIVGSFTGAQVYSRGSDGKCTAQKPPVSESELLFVTGDEIAPSAFVAAQTTVE